MSEYVAIKDAGRVSVYHEYMTGGTLDILTLCGQWMGTKTRRENAAELRLCRRCAAKLARNPDLAPGARG